MKLFVQANRAAIDEKYVARGLDAPDGGLEIEAERERIVDDDGTRLEASDIDHVRDIRGADEEVCVVGEVRQPPCRLGENDLAAEAEHCRGHIEALAHEATTVLGFGGEIIFAEATGGLPDFAYHADLFVGATNVTDVIDVGRLKPGAIIVDDSFPLCFDLEAAIRRIESAGDILFVNGGSIRLNEELHWNCALPAGTPAVSRSFLSQALLPSSEMITGCILSALLPQAGDFRPTIGAVTLEHCRDYWRGFGHLGIAAAPLHCGTWSPKSADLDRFRSSVRQISRTARRKSPRVR